MALEEKARHRTRVALAVAAAGLAVGIGLLVWQDESQTERSDAPDGTERAIRAPENPATKRSVDEPPEDSARTETSLDEQSKEPTPSPPKSELRWLTELPAIYRGDALIRGTVVDEKSRPVGGALVYCTPFLWTPFAKPQFKALSRRTDARGAFVFRDFPKSEIYAITVFSDKGHASARYLAPKATGAALQIHLSPVFYERIGFYRDDGEPIDITSSYFRIARGGILFGSNTTPPSAALRIWFAETGHPLASEAHEAVYIYPAAAAYARHGNRKPPTQPRNLRPPGFRAVEVPESRRPIAEWPKPTGRVTLRESKLPEGQRRYRCVLPDIAPPSWWGAREAYKRLSVAVLIGPRDRAAMFMAISGREEFIGPVHEQIEVKLNHALTLPFRQTERDGILVLEPQLGEAGYVSLHYPPGREDRPGVGTLLFVSPVGSNTSVAIQHMWPGFARLGPIPVGEYFVNVVWARTGESLLASPVHFKAQEGWQRVDVE